VSLELINVISNFAVSQLLQYEAAAMTVARNVRAGMGQWGCLLKHSNMNILGSVSFFDPGGGGQAPGLSSSSCRANMVSPIDIVTCMCVTIDGVWLGDCIYRTLIQLMTTLYKSLSQTGVHSHVFTNRCLVAASNG
jgi:hypothetical protein